MAPLKFLCSYGGQILPSRSGLRYSGGTTRVLSLDLSSSSTSFPDFLLKLAHFCGAPAVEMRCQLPNGDLETLVSVRSFEELSAVVEEYDRVSPGSKIRAILSPPLDHRRQNKKFKTVSPPPSIAGFDSYNSFKTAPLPMRCYPGDVAVGVPVGLYNCNSFGFGSWGSRMYR
ncbi:hypothetical protein LINGRAHAP2_LOCUS36218 [Linum grandiflorum]